MLLNVAGAGVPGNPVSVFYNTLDSACVPGVQFLCQQTFCLGMNIVADSLVDRRSETGPVTAVNISLCP